MLLHIVCILALSLVQAAELTECFSCIETNSNLAPKQYSEVLNGISTMDVCSKATLVIQCADTVSACLSAVYMLELEDNDAPVIHAMRVYGCGTTRRQNNLCENFNTTVSGTKGVTLTRCTLALCPDNGCNEPKVVFNKAEATPPVPTVSGPTEGARVDPLNGTDLVFVDPVDGKNSSEPEIYTGDTETAVDEKSMDVVPLYNNKGNGTTMDDGTMDDGTMDDGTMDDGTMNNGTMNDAARNMTMIEEEMSDTNTTNFTEEDEEVEPLDETINETITKVVEDIDEVVGNVTNVEDGKVKGEKEVMEGAKEDEGVEVVESSSSLLVPGTVMIVLLFLCL